ncbi:MAG: HDOD domain-containing protein [Myxococcales bacterium]|nr:HDOD domain-containing protein [Myxococcales bacterium]
MLTRPPRARRSLRAPRAEGRRSVAPAPTVEAFVARQAILDREGKLLGYQLLFRDAAVDRANVIDPDEATATVLLNTFVDMGLTRVVGESRMFIEFPKQTLLAGYPGLLPSARVILQVPAETEPSIMVMSALSCLRGRGYKIALNRFSPSPEARRLLGVADYVKLDVLETPEGALRASIDCAHAAGVLAVASRVEDRIRYEAVRALGIDFFQGFYLADPQIVADRRASDGTRVLELLRAVHDPEVTIDRIDEIARSDVLLSYRLVRCLNSAAFALPQRVQSVRHALVLLGLENLRKWASVLALAASPDKPLELTRIALIRAQMCANLAPHVRCDARALFAVGLFSVLDALLDRPMAEILETLHLDPELTLAILRREGKRGAVLGCAIAYERGDWDGVRLPGASLPAITSAWLRAVAWADEVASSFGEAGGDRRAAR